MFVIRERIYAHPVYTVYSYSTVGSVNLINKKSMNISCNRPKQLRSAVLMLALFVDIIKIYTYNIM